MVADESKADRAWERRSLRGKGRDRMKHWAPEISEGDVARRGKRREMEIPQSENTDVTSKTCQQGG